MAVNLETQYPGKVAPSSPAYPYGAARNITVPGDGTGTPWEAALANDIIGFQQAMLSEAALVPSGSPDTATASQYLDALKSILQTRATLSGRTVEARLDDVRSASDFEIEPGSDVTAELNALAGQVSGKRVFFGPGVYTMNGVLWDSVTDFELHFHPDCEFKLADSANTFAFRLNACSNFKISGRLKADGNKANNTTGGSGPGASNGILALSSCSDFEVESMFCKDAHTMGIAFESCTDWKAGRLGSDNSARVGVSVYLCTDFDIENAYGDGSDISNVFRMENNQRFSVATVRTANAATVGALIEVGNSQFEIGWLFDEGSFSGSKVEDSSFFSIGAMYGKDADGSHGVILNTVTDYNVGVMIGTGATSGDGVALLAAGAPHGNGHIGQILASVNSDFGLQIQRSGDPAGQFNNVDIGSVICNSNTLSNMEVDGGVLSGAVSIGRFRGGNPGVGRYDVEDATPSDPTLNRASIDDFDFSATSNYSNAPTLAADSPSPNIGQFLRYTNIVDTANTVPTVVTNLTGYEGIGRAFYIFVADNNTTFANGAGTGRIIVQGSSVAASFGELWQVTYRNDIMYLHKVS